MAAPVPVTAGPATRSAGLSTALAWSGVRCLLTYVLLPVAAPALGLLAALATPLVVALLVMAAGLSTRAAWRSWAGERHGACLVACALLSVNLASLGHQLAA